MIFSKEQDAGLVHASHDLDYDSCSPPRCTPLYDPLHLIFLFSLLGFHALLSLGEDGLVGGVLGQ